MSRRSHAMVLLAVIVVTAMAGPANAASRATIRGSTVRVTVPVSIHGAIAEPDALTALARQGRALAGHPLHDCFVVAPTFRASTGSDAHVITVLDQRPGQFLRPTEEGSPDPYAGSRHITIGSLAFRTGAPLEGPLPLLLAQQRPGGGGGLDAFINDVLRRTNARPKLTPCRWKGSLELKTVFDKYHLTVTATVPFTFVVTAFGHIDGDVTETVRAAVADDPNVGHCSASSIPMFPIGLDGTASGGEFHLIFHAKGPEPDFKLPCSGGSLDIGGDYLRALFLPIGKLTFDLNERADANATSSNSLQGRDGVAKVSITRA